MNTKEPVMVVREFNGTPNNEVAERRREIEELKLENKRIIHIIQEQTQLITKLKQTLKTFLELQEGKMKAKTKEKTKYNYMGVGFKRYGDYLNYRLRLANLRG